MYQRKTRDEWQIHQLTAYGWEEVSAYDTRTEAKADLKEYRENQPEFPARPVKARVKIDQVNKGVNK